MRQSGNIKILLIVILVLILLGVIALLWINHLNYQELIRQENDKGLPLQQAEDILSTQIKLYFGAERNEWGTETRQIDTPSLKIEDRITNVVEALLKGPEKLKSSPIPKGTQLIKPFLDQDGIAYLDFSEELQQNHPGGTWGEMMTIYSLVNTVMENFHIINGVKILIMGNEIETLKGHIDTRYPFVFRDKP